MRINHTYQRPSLRQFSIVVLLLALAAGVAAQSRIPEGDANYLSAANNRAAGTLDDYVVVFFEVPDSVTQTIYFAINDPDMNFVSETADPGDSRSDSSLYGLAVANPQTAFYLFGGNGALSDATSRTIDYATQGGTPFAGSELARYTTANIGSNLGWVYFPGVSPAQGERIGNKYYFKVVVLVSSDTGWIKNGFQLDASFSSGGTPTGISSIRSFAYAWPVSFSEASFETWNLYPFIPDGQTGNIVYYNWDMDGAGALTAWNRDAAVQSVPSVPPASGDSTNKTAYADAASVVYSIAGSDSGTWRLSIVEQNSGVGDNLNVAEFWFSDGTGAAPAVDNPFRVYAKEYNDAPLADHIGISPTPQTVPPSTGAFYALQVLSAGGDPVNQTVAIQVGLSGTGTGVIYVAGAPQANPCLVTTDSSGAAQIEIRDANPNTISITLLTDTTGGSTDLLNALANGSGVLNVLANPLPTLSSLANTSFVENAVPPQNLSNIVITDLVSADFDSTNDLRLILPAGLEAVFDNTVLTVTLSGANVGSFDVAYANGDRVAAIDITGAFAVGTTTISGLRLDGPYAVSSGALGLSWDGSAVAAASDDKFITIASQYATYVWNGTAGTGWATAANWTPNGVPDAATVDVVVPVVGSGDYPLLAGPIAVRNLSVTAGASLDIGAQTITVDGTLDIQGSLLAAGGGLSHPGGSLGGSLNAGTGTLRFTGPITLTSDLSVSAGSVIFEILATVNGPYHLTVNAVGSKDFSALIGNSNPPTGFSVSGAGMATFSAASYTMSGNTTVISSPATYTVNTTITDPDSITFESTVTIDPAVFLTLQTLALVFQGTVNGAGGLVLLPTAEPGTMAVTAGAFLTHSGGLSFGSVAGNTFNLTGLLDYTVGTATLYGNLAASNNSITLGALTVASDSSIGTGSGSAALGAVTSVASSLSMSGDGDDSITSVALGSGSLTLSAKAAGSTTVNGSLSAAALVGSSQNITVAGNLAVTDLTASGGQTAAGGDFSVAGTLNPNGGAVLFNGGAAQAITAVGSGNFYGLSVNKAGTLSVNVPITVSNTLT
ncbi:MAG TPA: hypothetical protein DIV58_06610, partial [Spirochaetaceae bacterium]|nr:hypothetical protein [Spirochaetaceae bacterium]